MRMDYERLTMPEFIEKYPQIEKFELFWLESNKSNQNIVSIGDYELLDLWTKHYFIDTEYSIIGNQEDVLDFCDGYGDIWTVYDTLDLVPSGDGFDGILRQEYDPKHNVFRVIQWVDRTYQEPDNYFSNCISDDCVYCGSDVGIWEWYKGVTRHIDEELNLSSKISEVIPNEISMKEFRSKHPNIKEVLKIRIGKYRFRSLMQNFNYVLDRKGKFISKSNITPIEDCYHLDTVKDTESFVCFADDQDNKTIISQQIIKNTLCLIYHDVDYHYGFGFPEYVIDCESKIMVSPFDVGNIPTYEFDL